MSQQVIGDADRVAKALPPLRQKLLALLIRPESATSLARQLDLPRQKVNYHLRELERAGLVELVEERRRRGLVERRLRTTARAWVIDPALLAEHAVDPTAFQDQFASAYLVTTAAQLIRDVAALRQRAHADGQRLATFTFEAEIAFASPRELRAFSSDLQACFADLAKRYHHAGGRRFRMVVAAHPHPHPQPSAPGEAP